ncbi:MAG: PAS domain S-box protein [Pirellulales bacterium]|nr:PAS domain S-box protein [Pirellulales bacterium]
MNELLLQNIPAELRLVPATGLFLSAIALALGLLLLMRRRRLRESIRELRGISDGMQDGLLVIDIQTRRLVRTNRSMCRLLGYSEDELLSLHVEDIHPPDDLAEVMVEFTAQTEGRKSLSGNIPLFRSDRSVFYGDIASHLSVYHGRRCLVAFVRDVTERKLAEEQLRASEEKMRTISDAALDAVIMIDPTGHVVHWNPAAETMFGYCRQEIMGVAVHEILTPELYRQQANRGLSEHAQSGRGPVIGKTVELEAQRKDGSLFPMEISLSSLTVDGGWGAVAIIRDITERKQALEALRDSEQRLRIAKQAAEVANRAKSEFLANMSHEIRTPMTAILGFADVAAEYVTSAEGLEAVNTIRRNGDHLLELLNSILDLSKIEAGKLAVEQTACSPCQIVNDVVSLMRARAVAKGLTLMVRHDTAVPQTIRTDPTRFRQMLLNLVGNAVKFTEVGTVEIVGRLLDANSQQPRLEIRVVDTGIGMSDAEMNSLFRPFTQADSSTTREYGGTGLGLTITKRLAETLGGDIRVASTPGRGSTLTLTIPTGSLDGVPLIDHRRETEHDSPPAYTCAEGGHTLVDCRVLLAEDGVDNQRLISILLKKVGAEVVIVDNGQRAVDRVLADWKAERPFDVVLMDMQMPVTDGFQATKILRDEGYDGPIIALTAHAMAGDREKCLDAGCSDYMTKPIDRQTLLNLVAKHLPRCPAAAAHGA